MDAAKKKALANKYKKYQSKAKKKADPNKGTVSDQVDSVGELYKKYGLK